MSKVTVSYLSVLTRSAVKVQIPKRPYKAVVTKVYDVTGDGGIDMVDVAELFKSGDNALTQLNGDGDFRSLECVTCWMKLILLLLIHP